MRRRDVITLLGGAAVTGALPAAAQQPKLPTIVILSPAQSENTPLFAAFRARLKALGHTEGLTVRVDIRLARGSPAEVRALAADLVASTPDVIVGDGLLMARTLKALTTTIPVVAILGSDPVGAGLVDGLSRPGGNITGVSMLGTELHPKRIEILQSAVPRLSRLAVLWDQGNDMAGLTLKAITDYAKGKGIRLDLIEGGHPDLVASTFTPQRLKDADAVLVASGPNHWNNRATIIKTIAAAGKPAVFAERDYVADGGLMSYGPNVADVFRRLAEYADRILKGAKPADLAVQQPVTFETAISLKTAKALGLTIPPLVLAQADEVIE